MPTTLRTTSNDSYLELVQTFPLRPIRTASAHRQAKAILRNLIGKRGAAVRDYKSVLVALVVDYERSANHRLNTSKVTAADVVLHLLDERDMSVNALAKILAVSQSSLSDMINGRRDWSKQAIIRISSYFGLEPGLFLR
jgi:HTH-type transcriptional regulator/antitoxin HigA